MVISNDHDTSRITLLQSNRNNLKRRSTLRNSALGGWGGELERGPSQFAEDHWIDHSIPMNRTQNSQHLSNQQTMSCMYINSTLFLTFSICHFEPFPFM